MIELTNSIAQTLAPGQSATFDTVILQTGCAECHRPNSGSITLTRKNTIYEVEFYANVGDTAIGDAQIGITLNGSPLVETNAISTTAAAGDLNRVSSSTFIQTCCCGVPDTLLLTNTGTTTINIGANPIFKVKKII